LNIKLLQFVDKCVDMPSNWKHVFQLNYSNDLLVKYK
jgi:hypothetical protein